MSSYIHFTEEQKQRAAAVDLEEFLRCRGEKLITSGREKRLASDHSVTVRGNEWYDHAEERGGHAVSFVQKFYGLSYPDAVTMLLGGEMGTVYPPAGDRVEEPPKPFVLPPANKDMRRVYAYLVKHRGIDRSVVAHFAREKLLYEDADYHNAVFVGTDEEGVPRHAHKRSANSYGKAFRLNVEGSDPRHSFHHIGTDGSLYVFEAPIDMLSYITLHPEKWQEHSYAACCGTSIQPVLKMLERVPQLDTVLLCLDNDEAGHLASQRMSAQLTEHYAVERLIPENKDWNDDLTASNEQGNEVTIRRGGSMSYFGTIYADTELPSRARAVYMYLHDRSDAEGKCWPGIKTIASDMKLSRSTVKRALADLEKAGYLKKLPRYRENGSSTSNLYSIQ